MALYEATTYRALSIKRRFCIQRFFRQKRTAYRICSASTKKNNLHVLANGLQCFNYTFDIKRPYLPHIFIDMYKYYLLPSSSQKYHQISPAIIIRAQQLVICNCLCDPIDHRSLRTTSSLCAPQPYNYHAYFISKICTIR